MVDAVRIGTITAHDAKAARQWAAERARLAEDRPAGEGLTGEALEQAVMRLALVDVHAAPIVVFKEG